MTSWIGLLGVLADVVILGALVMVAASRKMSQLARLVIATLAFACAWLVATGLDAMGARGWTIFIAAAVIVVSIVVITGALYLWTQEDDGGPNWWPDFEREFANYVAERERYV